MEALARESQAEGTVLTQKQATTFLRDIKKGQCRWNVVNKGA